MWTEEFIELCVCVFFNYLCQVLVAACNTFELWHVGSSSLTRGQTCVPCAGNMES